ncbi:MAG: nuclear transport factor 2 family protein [Chitinophagales bacterium]|nr:nuclear transport factor 2 family protein [Chitinophagales bacterium]
MNKNEQIIHKFYTSFRNKDFKGMQDCYADNATFSDPVFQNLQTAEVKSMWEMFCVKGKDLKIEFKNISANEKTGSAEWTAFYTFSATGNTVENHIRASFTFENGKFIRHTDRFNFYKWSRQALGLTGLLLGWTPLLKNKIRKAAGKNLHQFMNKG